jgi:hypothetical protein
LQFIDALDHGSGVLLALLAQPIKLRLEALCLATYLGMEPGNITRHPAQGTVTPFILAQTKCHQHQLAKNGAADGSPKGQRGFRPATQGISQGAHSTRHSHTKGSKKGPKLLHLCRSLESNTRIMVLNSRHSRGPWESQDCRFERQKKSGCEKAHNRINLSEMVF